MELLQYILENKGKVLLDGGMGTQLEARGAPMSGLACLSHPEVVLAVHQVYVESGANILITNTLTMNRVHFESHGLELDVREANLAGAKLARQAADGGQYVLGDMSTTGKMLAPLGTLSEEDAMAAFKEQAIYLAEGGADGFIIETMFDLNEAILAVQACKAAADLPVIASMTFETLKRGGRTIMGNSAADCARNLSKAGADVVGTNCGSLTPLEMSEIVAIMVEATDRPIAVQPNAGKPQMEGDVTVFDMQPEPFAEGISACLAKGASIIGGCCGTTPEHIAVLADLIG